MEDALDDEFTSINSIYGDEHTLELVDKENRICTLKLPTESNVVLRLEFPTNYPDAAPSILGTESVGNYRGTGQRIVRLGREVLVRVYREGEPCLYDFIEDMTIELGAEDENDQNQAEEEHIPELSHTEDLGPEPPWSIAAAITERKSVFLGRVAAVSSPEEARSFLRHFLATDKKAARATHNITAWRIKGPDGMSYQDCDDDGETAAGGRLLHLMQLMDVWNVMVVVTRWYGGVLLGPDRFRIINSAARDALIVGGFATDGKKTKK